MSLTLSDISTISYTVAMTGYGYNLTRKSLDSGKENPEITDERIRKILEEEQKRVLPVYNSKGKLIEYDEHGRHLNLSA